MRNFQSVKFLKFQLILPLILTYFCWFYAWGALPSLPPDWRAGLTPSQQWVLVDFYSKTCGTCQAMEPQLKKMQKTLGDKIKFVRADIYNPNHRPLGQLFDVSGTPTYILFKRDGSAVYRMQHTLSAEILRSQLYRISGVTKPQKGFDSLPQVSQKRAHNPYVLLAIHPKNCAHCTTMLPSLNAIGKVNDLAPSSPSIAVITLDPGNKAITDWLKINKYKPVETYAFYDNQGRVLFYSPYPLTPQELWKRMKLYTNMGLD